MSSPDATPTQRIVRLVGVYDADSTLRGELSYWVGARLGRRHCSLCEITHGSVRQRPEWKTCQDGLPVPFDTYHRNDQPDSIRTASGGEAPVVVAVTDTGHMLLLGAEDLDACDGSIDRLVEAIEESAARLGLTSGARVNTAQLDRFNRFFDGHYEAMVAEIADSDPSGAVRRTRAGFTSAYRFWDKVEDDGDPVGWVRRVIADDRHTRSAVPEPVDEPGTPAALDSSAERHHVIALARRQRVVASVVLGLGTLVAIGVELFVAHR